MTTPSTSNAIKNSNEIKEKPLVSAILLTHNRKDLVIEAIKSVLNQTYKPIELIVVDDASTDGTPEILESMAHESGFKFISISPEDSKGGNYARNVGINASNGTYIAFLDDDDEWMPDKTVKQVQLLENHPECGVCYCGRIFDYNLGEYQSPNDVSKLKEGNLSKDIFRNTICVSSTMMIKRMLLYEVGLFDEDLRFWQDYELCMRLFQKTEVAVVRKNLVLYRVLLADASRLTNKIDGWERAVEQIYTKHAAEIHTLNTDEQKAKNEFYYKDGARRCSASGDKARQRYFLWKVFKVTHKPKDLAKALLNTTSIRRKFHI